MASPKARKLFTKHRSKDIYSLLLSFTISSFIILFFLCLFFIHDLPDLDNLETKGRRASVTFESYDGEIIATYGDLFKNVVTVDELPKHVPQAIIAIEDHRFYQHSGVDILGILRATFTNIVHGKVVQGGSTLTQQLAKNLFLSNYRSLKRKVQEFILAIWLEKRFTKKQLLSIYLNRVYFGSGAYGIDAASYKFFNKSAKHLTICEAAKLAGVLKSPTAYSPFYNQQKSNSRTDLVLSKMRECNYITEAEFVEAKNEKDHLKLAVVPIDENRYFTDWVMEQLHGIMIADNDDLIVRTTLDSRLQKNATYVIRQALNESGFKNGANQMALVALDSTGAVRAMVGGHTYGSSQYNRALAVRAFGSSFKIFVYITALEHGVQINDLISDEPIKIGTWSPRNYKYQSEGKITVQKAFVKSVNTSAIRLAQKVGIDAVIDKAIQMGISSDLERNYASALGASSVNLLEMTACYGTIMNNGLKMCPFGIMSIKNQKGRVLYRAKQNKEKSVIPYAVCENMKIMMKDIIEHGTGKRAKLPIDAYGKTGTSNDSRDANFIGFSYPLVVGVWTGNDDNSPMNQSITGGTLPATTWKEFMMAAFGFSKDKEKTTVSRKRKLSSILNSL